MLAQALAGVTAIKHENPVITRRKTWRTVDRCGTAALNDAHIK
jgi:hypothetical protein